MSSATRLEGGLDAAVRDRQQELVRFVENLWDKYQVALSELRNTRNSVVSNLDNALSILGYL